MLQNVKEHIAPLLETLYRACISMNYVPQSWRRVKVVFIPKPGRKNHETAKDFRPLSLTSFVLKALERLIDIYIRSFLGEESLSTAQHAYIKGKSTESALHEVVGLIEKSLRFKQYTLAAFLDIEGAFNNIEVDTIIQSLMGVGVDGGVVGWVRSMLESRIIQAKSGDSLITRYVRRGTPQGGVLSPLLWVVALNSILLELNRDGVKVVAYADDVVIAVTGPFLSTVSEILGKALGRLHTWAKGSGLNVNQTKLNCYCLLISIRYHNLDFHP